MAVYIPIEAKHGHMPCHVHARVPFVYGYSTLTLTLSIRNLDRTLQFDALRPLLSENKKKNALDRPYY